MESTTPPPAGDQTAPPASAPGPQRSGDGFFSSVRRAGLVRTEDRWIGGVAGGLALRLGLDPLLVRGLLGVTVLLGGAGLVLYGIAWALLPEEVDGRIHLEETAQGRFDAAVLGAIALVVVGLSRGSGWLWWGDTGLGWVDGLLWAAAAVAVTVLVVAGVNRRRTDAVPGGDPAWAATAGPSTGSFGGGGGGAGGGRGKVPHPGYGPVPYAAAATAPPPPGASAAAGSRSGTTTGTEADTPASAVPPPPSWSTPSTSTAPPTGGPYGPTPYRPGPPVPPPPPRPTRPRVHGPGAGAVGVVVGLTLLALAALLVLQREGELGDVPVGLTTLGIGVVLIGLAIMLAGLRGRSSGTLGFLGVVGVLVAIPVALVDGPLSRLGLGGMDGVRVSSGQTWTPVTAAEARDGVSAGFGDLRVDLTEIPLGDRVVEVPISMSAGDLTVVVPDDAAVTGAVDLTAGELTWQVDGSEQVSGLLGGDTEWYASDEVDDRDVELDVRITVGAGSVRVVEEDR